MNDSGGKGEMSARDLAAKAEQGYAISASIDYRAARAAGGADAGGVGMSEQKCATSGTDNPSRTPWRYAHAAGIEGLHWDIYAGEGIDGWLVASVATEADAALITSRVNREAAERMQEALG